MVLVPRGEPVYEQLGVGDFHPPTMMGTLRTNRLTGYARFVFRKSSVFEDASAIFVFNDGRLAEALFEDGGKRRLELAAFRATFDRLAAGDGTLSVYQLSPDLTASVHALLHGTVVFDGQALGLVNVKVVLDKLRQQGFTGCLRIYTDERTALIFYKQGQPLGFFHDGASGISATPGTSQNIAKLPGAKIDAYATREAELHVTDLLAQVDANKTWVEAAARQEVLQEERLKEEAAARRARRAEEADAFEATLRELVGEHLGATGRQMFDKVLADHLGRAAMEGGERLGKDLAELEKAARLLTSASKTQKLLDAVRSKIDTWNATRLTTDH